MPHTFDLTVNADIYKYPTKIQTFGSNTKLELTTNNFYGNAMKLIYFLVTSGVMQVTEDDYSNLAAIYQKDYKTLTNADVENFELILNKPQTRFNAGAFLRFTGGILADKGVNNYSNLFILLVLKRLDSAVIPYKILFSKPDAWFIECCEGKKSFYRHPKPKKNSATDAVSFLFAKQDSSAHNLHFILQDDISPAEPIPDPVSYNKLSITRQNILDIIQKAYTAHLQAVSYTLSDDKKEIIIYSPAASGLETIKRLSTELLGKKKYNNKTPTKLAETIDSINDAFVKRAMNADITQAREKPALYSSAAAEAFTQWLKDNQDETSAENFTTPFQFPALVVLACNNKKSSFLERPAIRHKKYFYHYVYGRCKDAPSSDLETNHRSLDHDNLTGKSDEGTGNYRIIISVRNINDLPLLSTSKPLQSEINERLLISASDAIEIASSSAAEPCLQAITGLQTSETVNLFAGPAVSPVTAIQNLSPAVINPAPSFTEAQANTFFPADIAVGLKTLQADILTRHWITNMGGETIAGAATKVPKSTAEIYIVINNAEFDQNNHPVEIASANWFATRALVVNILEQAFKADHFSRDPQTHQWLNNTFTVGQRTVFNSRGVPDVIVPQIENEKIADIFNNIKQTALTGGQTILVEDASGTVQSKKVPRTFAQIYTIIRQAQKDKNSNNVINPDWKTVEQKIFETAKVSAENRTKFRSDATQKAIVDMVNDLTSNVENFQAQFDSIKTEILRPANSNNKQPFGYSIGFFSKVVEAVTVSWKEKEILDFIQQAQDGLLPIISAAEKISAIISASKQNLAFLNAANTDLTPLLNTPYLSSLRFEVLQGHIP
jgi:hypothetical protein